MCEQVSRINDVRSLCLFVVCACLDMYSSVYLSVSVSMSVSISREKVDRENRYVPSFTSSAIMRHRCQKKKNRSNVGLVLQM